MSEKQQLAVARGKALRSAREQAGKSARELAELASAINSQKKWSTDAVYAYENGRVLLSVGRARVFAWALGVPIEQLLCESLQQRPTQRFLTEGDVQFLQEMLGKMETLTLDLAFQLLLHRKVTTDE